MQDNLARNIGAYAKRVEITFTKLTRNLLELDEITYKKCVVLVRRRELLKRCMRIKKINKPTNGGTKITFELIESLEDVKKEFEDVYKNISELNMSHEELEEGLEW